MSPKLKLEKCPGCGAPCEVTAEYKAADGILISIGDENTCEFGYFGGPAYRIVCIKCQAHLVSASIMGLPASTSVAVKIGPCATVTNRRMKPGEMQLGGCQPKKAETSRTYNFEKCSGCGGHLGLSLSVDDDSRVDEVWINPLLDARSHVIPTLIIDGSESDGIRCEACGTPVTGALELLKKAAAVRQEYKDLATIEATKRSTAAR